MRLHLSSLFPQWRRPNKKSGDILSHMDDNLVVEIPKQDIQSPIFSPTSFKPDDEKEVVPNERDRKQSWAEVVAANPPEVVHVYEPPVLVQPGTVTTDPPLKKNLYHHLRQKHTRSLCYCSIKLRLWVEIVILLIALALILALAIVFGRHKSHSPLDGSFIGFAHTGMVAIDFANGQRDFVFFVTGADKKVMSAHFENGAWQNQTEEVSSIISESTTPDGPLMAVSYTYQDELSWRIISVNKKGYLQDFIGNSAAKDWYSGPLSGGGYQYAQAGICLTACANTEYYVRLEVHFIPIILTKV
jgi:hypothetical protein